MNHRRFLNARASAAALVLAGATIALAVGCVETGTTAGVDDGSDITPTNPGGDAAAKPPGTVTADGGADGATPTATEADACPDGSCGAAPSGCAARPDADFCDDFDDADALTPGKTKWDFVEPTAQPVATLSTARMVSAPNSLLSRVIDATTPGAKFAKTVAKAGFTEVTWEYDVFLDSVGTDDGFFLDDFQFSDQGGPDRWGFRLVTFAEPGGALREIKVEHNGDAAGTPYQIEAPLAAGTVTLGKWHHFKQHVKFTFPAADAGADAGAANRAQYTLWVDDSAVPAFRKEYVAPPRSATTHARIAGLPLIFNKGKSAGLAIHWDNHTLSIK